MLLDLVHIPSEVCFPKRLSCPAQYTSVHMNIEHTPTHTPTHMHTHIHTHPHTCTHTHLLWSAFQESLLWLSGCPFCQLCSVSMSAFRELYSLGVCVCVCE